MGYKTCGVSRPAESDGSPLGGPFSLVAPLDVTGEAPEWFVEAVAKALATLDYGLEYRSAAPGLWKVLQQHAADG